MFRAVASRPAAPRKIAAVLACLAVAALLLVGCARRPAVVLEPLRALESKTPVVFVPGLTGSRLRDPQSGRMIWGNAKSLFLPRDGGYVAAMPIDPASGYRSDLEATEVLTSVRIPGLHEVDIYASFVRAMEANGYRLGEIHEPRPGDTLFLFPYDFRRRITHAAGELGRRLEQLRQSRGEPVLRVNLVCHSNAAQIARYFLKYGNATLEQAEAGSARPPTTIRVDKLILIGAPNGGALKLLKDLHRGRTYVRWVGRKIRPETLFSYESMYEALPSYRDDLFVDGEGRVLNVDLFDTASWKRYGWSVFGRAASRRLERGRRSDIFGDGAAREAFLTRNLDRARRVQRLLREDVEEFGDTRYYFVQNVYRPTLQRGVLVEQRGEWTLLFDSDKRVRRDPYLLGRITVPGDGHATHESQEWMSPQETRATARPPVLVQQDHRKMITSPATHRWILEFLLE